jgi:hypothetical protein
VAAGGALAVARIRVRPLGVLGLVYGNMRIQDLVRTSLDPTAESSGIPYGTQLLGVNWILTTGGTTLGSTVGWEHARLDETQSDRATLDVGLRQELPGPLWLALASHLLSPLTSDDRTSDFYGGIECAVWHGTSWIGSGTTTVSLRYGAAVAHGLAPDHQFGVGIAFNQALALDIRVVREDTYGAVGWRGSAGLRLGIGPYRVGYARDTGQSDVGSAYRVGLEAGIK